MLHHKTNIVPLPPFWTISIFTKLGIITNKCIRSILPSLINTVICQLLNSVGKPGHNRWQSIRCWLWSPWRCFTRCLFRGRFTGHLLRCVVWRRFRLWWRRLWATIFRLLHQLVQSHLLQLTYTSQLTRSLSVITTVFIQPVYNKFKTPSSQFMCTQLLLNKHKLMLNAQHKWNVDLS